MQQSLLQYRENKGKLRSPAFYTLHFYITMMQQHDLFAKAKPYATAVFAGGKKWHKYFVQQVLRHAGTIVFDVNMYFVVGTGCGR